MRTPEKLARVHFLWNRRSFWLAKGSSIGLAMMKLKIKGWKIVNVYSNGVVNRVDIYIGREDAAMLRVFLEEDR